MKKVIRKKKKAIVILAVTVAILLSVFVFCAIYVSDYYRAKDAEIEAFMPNMTTEVYENDYISFGNPSEIGFIFYPGGKVEHTAYIPLMRAIASEGIFCVLVKMPFNLAVLDSNAAENIIEDHPEVGEWYIGGHSLGGSMAASYLSKNEDKLSGLVLLGAYSTADLSGSSLRVLSVFGSEDGVMNREKYEKCKENLPTSFTETVIDGGSHAGFGMYGEQKGDGEAGISAEEQILITAEAILSFFGAER